MKLLGEPKPGIATAFMEFGIVIATSLLIFFLLFYLIKAWAKKRKHYLPELINIHFRLPGLCLMICAIISGSLPAFKSFVKNSVYNFISHAAQILLICSIAYLVLKMVTFLYDWIIKYYLNKAYKDYTLRSVRTKFNLLKKIIHIIVIVITVAVIITTFEQARQLGTTLLASAGIAGIVIGFAAQKSLGTLFSGIQIAITQPIKLDDTVVVEDQFGTIGEITLTYAVVNTWAGKRLIVPINYFLENTFENWTRVSPEVVGQVKIFTDYSLPVDEIRKKIKEWVEINPLWDKRRCSVLVIDANDKTMTIRATMSAKDSDDAWDLECQLREKLITYIQQNYPESLPLLRVKQLPPKT
jgi:small-conductance mechanosensitive channel